MLLGIAIRTGSPLSLNLAEPVWKQLAGLPLSVTDLTEADKDYVPGMCAPLLVMCKTCPTCIANAIGKSLI